MPLQMVFIIPEGMQTSGWVNDFGAAIMLNTDGRKYLLGREEAHGDHEAMHRLLMYEEPEVFLEILKIHPYLDESMAILASLLLSKSNSKGLFEGLPLGNEAYQNELMVEKLLEPLIFDELDGGQEFDTNLYCQWMVLAMFWQTLLEAKFGQKNKLTEPASVETVLKLGWLEMMDGWRKNDVYRGKEILNGLVEGLRTVTAGRAMSDESLLEEIFGEVIEAKSGESMKELLETKYLQLAAKNYLVWRLINTKDEYGFWGKQDERLRAAIGEELGEELVKELWHIPKQEAINLIFDRILGL